MALQMMENSRQEKTSDALTTHETPRVNNTGIPTAMKERFEAKSGLSFDDVKVHYNSDKPAQLQALAFTQGNQVYVGAGQEKHLRHELGHVIQQKQGIVKPTNKVNGITINNDSNMEYMADQWGTASLFAEGEIKLSRLEMIPKVAPIQLKMFYHGRSETRKEASDDPKPLNKMHSRHSLDFDPIGKGGIYFAHKHEVSKHWAEEKAKRARIDCLEKLRLSKPWVIPVVYKYEVSNENLSQLHSYKTWETQIEDGKIAFSSKEQQEEWGKFVLDSRLKCNHHSFDYISGPMMSNPVYALELVRIKSESDTLENIENNKVDWNKEADQTAIYTDEARSLFQNGFVEREVLPFNHPDFIKFEDAFGIISSKQSRAEISRSRLRDPSLESTHVMKQYTTRLRNSIVEFFLGTMKPLEEHKEVLREFLMSYESLGDIVDTAYSIEILELEKSFSEDQQFQKKRDFQDELLKACDFRVLAALMSIHAEELMGNLGLISEKKYLKFTSGDFVSAYHICKTVIINKIPYMEELENVQILEPLGSGRKKDAFLLSDKKRVLVKMKSFDFFNTISHEISLLKYLKDKELPVVAILGITIHKQMPSMIMPFMPEQSKDFIAGSNPINTFRTSIFSEKSVSPLYINPTEHMTEQTLKSLVNIQKKLTETCTHVSDLQFLIGDDGSIVIADPRMVAEGNPSVGNIGTISYTLAAGIVKVLQLSDKSDRLSYLQIKVKITELTTLDDEKQIHEIVDIMCRKYKIKVDEQPLSATVMETSVKNQKEKTSEIDITKLKIDKDKNIIMECLSKKGVEKIDRNGFTRKFLSLKDSKDKAAIKILFGSDMTPDDFYKAYKALKKAGQVCCDETGLYLESV